MRAVCGIREDNPMAELIPSKSDPRWKELLTGVRDPQFTFLTTKLTVARLRQTIREKPCELRK